MIPDPQMIVAVHHHRIVRRQRARRRVQLPYAARFLLRHRILAERVHAFCTLQVGWRGSEIALGESQGASGGAIELVHSHRCTIRRANVDMTSPDGDLRRAAQQRWQPTFAETDELGAARIIQRDTLSSARRRDPYGQRTALTTSQRRVENIPGVMHEVTLRVAGTSKGVGACSKVARRHSATEYAIERVYRDAACRNIFDEQRVTAAQRLADDLELPRRRASSTDGSNELSIGREDAQRASA